MHVSQVSDYSRYNSEELYADEKSCIKPGDTHHLPQFPHMVKYKGKLPSPANQRYLGKVSAHFRGDFYFVLNCSRFLRVLLELAVHWLASDILSDLGYEPTGLTGDEGLLGPRARAVEAHRLLWDTILATPALVKAMPGPHGYMAEGGSGSTGHELLTPVPVITI